MSILNNYSYICICISLVVVLILSSWMMIIINCFQIKINQGSIKCQWRTQTKPFFLGGGGQGREIGRGSFISQLKYFILYMFLARWRGDMCQKCDRKEQSYIINTRTYIFYSSFAMSEKQTELLRFVNSLLSFPQLNKLIKQKLHSCFILDLNTSNNNFRIINLTLLYRFAALERAIKKMFHKTNPTLFYLAGSGSKDPSTYNFNLKK